MVVLAIAGALLNAAVTIANGGFMPVGGAAAAFAPKSGMPSLWVVSTSAHRLRALGDNWFGCSIGDVLIAVGMFGAVMASMGSCARSHRPSTPVTPTKWKVRIAKIFAGALLFVQAITWHSHPAQAVAIAASMCVLYLVWTDVERLDLRIAWYRQRRAEYEAEIANTLAKWPIDGAVQ